MKQKTRRKHKGNASWWPWKWFNGYDTNTTGNKNKNRQVRLLQTKKLLHPKGNNQKNEKATYRMGENIYKLYIWQGANIQNTWQTPTTQQEK